jgi:isopenicillin-N N-acyltransferase-like protein
MSRRLPVVDIAGSARDRGCQHGEAARDRIRRSLAYYRAMYLDAAGITWADATAAARERVPAIEAYAPGLLDEVRGIAEGAACEFDDILWLNGRAAPARRAQAQDGCTSFAVLPPATADGHTYCGQNWDWRAEILDTVIFLRITQPPKPTIVMQVEAGQIARQGANSAGIALNANALPGGVSAGSGIPGPYVRRRALDAWSMRDALLAVYEARRSGRVNLLLTHRDGVAIDLETTPQRIGVLDPRDGVLVHGNHFASFVPDDDIVVERPAWIDSLYRVPRATEILRGARRARTPDEARGTLATALRDHLGRPHSVCRHPDESVAPELRNTTLVSSIVDLTSGTYWATLGPPCEGDYERLPWSLYEASPAT